MYSGFIIPYIHIVIGMVSSLKLLGRHFAWYDWSSMYSSSMQAYTYDFQFLYYNFMRNEIERFRHIKENALWISHLCY